MDGPVHRQGLKPGVQPLPGGLLQEELDLLGVVQVGVPVLANTLDRRRIGGGGVGVAVPEKIPVAAVKAARTVVGPAVDTHKHRGAGRHAGGVWNRHTG